MTVQDRRLCRSLARAEPEGSGDRAAGDLPAGRQAESACRDRRTVSKLTPLPAWHQLAGRYDDQQLIGLVLCIGAYTMVAGFLNRLEIATMRKLTIEPGSD